MAALESTSCLLLPDRVVQPFVLAFSKPSALAASGVLALALGVYLTAYGFGVD